MSSGSPEGRPVGQEMVFGSMLEGDAARLGVVNGSGILSVEVWVGSRDS